ncbi:hypothetical protein BHE74_00004896 [Ensete ventricosum]|nr:hypothetical protein BHE74_00004896 [Ensete ventricosum]RZS09181.1 hypothetical protein BHM03_00040232 [Ensete ventricosum]
MGPESASDSTVAVTGTRHSLPQDITGSGSDPLRVCVLIKDLICRGHLDRYIRKPCEPSLRPKGPVERQVDVIIGDPIAGGDSSSARKAYAHAKVQKRPRVQSDPKITFESESEYPDHDDTLVIMACITNARVRRIMIDTRSSTDILYLDTSQKLGMSNQNLIPMTSTLTGFTGDAITPVGVATLPMTFDDEPRTFMVPFMVVELLLDTT